MRDHVGRGATASRTGEERDRREIVAARDQRKLLAALATTLWQTDVRGEPIAQAPPAHGVLHATPFGHVRIDRLGGTAMYRTMMRPLEREVVGVDVREDLRNGREPFARIMTTARALQDDQLMHLRAIFQPVPLFGVLESLGLSYEVEAHASDDWSVWCWRPSGMA